jgi:serine-type D-Ala-D-Ala carboxypeptidase/endopeptidase
VMRVAWAASLVASLAVVPIPAKSRVISNADIRQILVERIDVQRQGVGIVVGVIEPQGRRVVAYGKADNGDLRPLDGDTVFEIGSVTKVFTSLLLADMVQRSEVALTDPVTKYLPKEVRGPEHGGKAITLKDLATHTSGLPRDPTNLKPKDLSNPFADYTVPQLYEFLSGYTLTRDPGAEFEYSNVGMGLLGHALAQQAGAHYEELVRSRITTPLGMKSTAITLSPEMQARLAPGHNGEFSKLANFVESPALAGDGALRSSANDMLTFLAAQLGLVKTPLAQAMEYTLAPRRSKGSLGDPLGWDTFTQNGRKIVWHSGTTFGYNSFVGFVPKTRVGVVVLCNTRSLAGVDDIGFHLLDSRAPLAAAKTRHETELDPKVLDRYVGRYQIKPEGFLTVTHEGDGLFVQATNDIKCRLYPESERDFFLKIVDAQISFALGGQDRATELTLHQFGRHKVAKRIE